MTDNILPCGVGFLIPTYNPSESLVSVVVGLKRLIAEKGMNAKLFPILIVDDGSTKEESLNILNKLECDGFRFVNISKQKDQKLPSKINWRGEHCHQKETCCLLCVLSKVVTLLGVLEGRVSRNMCLFFIGGTQQNRAQV